MPQHILKLKIGSPIILMRNLNPPKAKNSTRCILKRVLGNVIEAVISVGQYRGETILIPRIPLLPTSVRAMIPIHASTVSNQIVFCNDHQQIARTNVQIHWCWSYSQCFTHGMQYVAASRTGSPDNLYFLTSSSNVKKTLFTGNYLNNCINK